MYTTHRQQRAEPEAVVLLVLVLAEQELMTGKES